MAVTQTSPRAKTTAESLEHLMEAYQGGRSTAFDALFAALAPRVHGFFVRSFGRTPTADDCLQTTFLKVHDARASYSPGRPVKPWVFGIAARVRADELRRHYRVPPHESDDDLAERVFETPPNPAEARERVDRVREAVNALPEGQRVVVLLHRFEGMSFGEVGESLGLKEGTVRVRAFRAYETLRRQLAPLMEDEG